MNQESLDIARSFSCREEAILRALLALPGVTWQVRKMFGGYRYEQNHSERAHI